MPRIPRPAVGLALAAGLVALAALAPSAAAQTETAEDLAEDARAHGEWAAGDPEGFAENHTTDPHRDPVGATAGYACRAAAEAGAGGGTDPVCAEQQEPPREQQEGEEAERDGTPGDEAGDDAVGAAGEVLAEAREFVGDVSEEPGEAPWHALHFVRDAASWVRDQVGLAAGTAAAGASVPVDAGLAAGSAVEDTAAAGAEKGREAVDGARAAWGVVSGTVGDAAHRAAEAGLQAPSSASAILDGMAGRALDGAGVAVDGLEETVDALASRLHLGEDPAGQAPGPESAPTPDGNVDEGAGGLAEALPDLG